MMVAVAGIAVNGIAAYLFMSGRKDNLNIKDAFLHMASDALVALGVVVAGALILWTGCLSLGPAISLVINVLVIAATWSLLRHSVNLSLDAVPEAIDQREVGTCLKELPGVTKIHDLGRVHATTLREALPHRFSAIREIPPGLPDS